MRLRPGIFFLVQLLSQALVATAGVISPTLSVENATILLPDSDLSQALVGDPLEIHINTCRWTNCNQDCAAGFVEIPRTGGERAR